MDMKIFLHFSVYIVILVTDPPCWFDEYEKQSAVVNCNENCFKIVKIFTKNNKS